MSLFESLREAFRRIQQRIASPQINMARRMRGSEDRIDTARLSQLLERIASPLRSPSGPGRPAPRVPQDAPAGRAPDIRLIQASSPSRSSADRDADSRRPDNSLGRAFQVIGDALRGMATRIGTLFGRRQSAAMPEISREGRSQPTRREFPGQPLLRPARQHVETAETILQSIRSILRRILEVLIAKLPASASRALQERWEQRAEAARRQGSSSGAATTAAAAAAGAGGSAALRVIMRGAMIIGALELLRRALDALAAKAIQATEALQEFSGPIAAQRARLEYQERANTARLAAATQDSAARLLDMQRRLSEESLGIRIAITNATNRLAAAWLDIKRIIVDGLTKLIPGFQPPKDGDIPLTPIGEFLSDIAKGEFGGRKNWPPPGWKR